MRGRRGLCWFGPLTSFTGRSPGPVAGVEMAAPRSVTRPRDAAGFDRAPPSAGSVDFFPAQNVLPENEKNELITKRNAKHETTTTANPAPV